MDCDWKFLDKDCGKDEVTISEPHVPVPGDGKWHNGKGYTVRIVIDGRTTTPNPAVVATEN